MKPVLSLVMGIAALMAVSIIGPSQASLSASMVQASDEIAYDDLDALYTQLVLDVGFSDRKVGPRPIPAAGTRMTSGNRKKTRSEANRVFYHLITDQGLVAIKAIRQSLEDLPGSGGFGSLPRNEKLAFWLNLRNLAVIELVAEEYPIRNAQKLIEGKLEDKWMTIQGQPWSIADIERHVVENWSNKLVLYGFHRGHIGSPNITRKAYTGRTVWRELEYNAREFTRSLRGLQFRRTTAEVSHFYKTVAYAFDDMRAELPAHMRPLLPRSLVKRLDKTERVRPKIKDGTVADLYAGRLSNLNAANTNSGALVSAFGGVGANGGLANRAFATASKGRSNAWPEHVRNLVGELSKRNSRRRLEGKVLIENVKPEKDRTKGSEEKKEDPQG